MVYRIYRSIRANHTEYFAFCPNLADLPLKISYSDKNCFISINIYFLKFYPKLFVLFLQCDFDLKIIETEKAYCRMYAFSLVDICIIAHSSPFPHRRGLPSPGIASRIVSSTTLATFGFHESSSSLPFGDFSGSDGEAAVYSLIRSAYLSPALLDRWQLLKIQVVTEFEPRCRSFCLRPRLKDLVVGIAVLHNKHKTDNVILTRARAPGHLRQTERQIANVLEKCLLILV